ncbi:putative protein S-acyltransferase 15 [Schistosoma japonicum]|nr:putative protein S-acyltransferase 15 [Schistosoma japonicum]KAH8861657.1 putative protein S-acyltransferase 15 [Schistosoma japonicum]
MKFAFLSKYIYIIRCLIRLYIPDLLALHPTKNLSSCKSVYEYFNWFLEIISNIYLILILEPILNCFSLYLGGRKQFSRILITLVLTYLGLILSLLYTVLIPRRLFILITCYEYHTTNCNLHFESLWFILHLILSHLIIINIYFHYLSAIFINPGNVSQFSCDTMNSICSRCFIARPLRAHHCAICKKCILCMDHHCPWTANCIGLYTHRHFYLVLIYMSIGGIYLLTVGWSDFHSYVIELNQNQVDATTKYSLNWFDQYTYLPKTEFFIRLYKGCFIFGLVSIPLVIALCIWHTYLISNGETSIERHINAKFTQILQQRGLIYRNPHNFGLFINWIKFLCLIDKHEMANINKRVNSFHLYSLLFKRLFYRVLLPAYPAPYNDGYVYELNVNTAESVLESLTESGMF